MPRITFVAVDQTTGSIDAKSGESLMQAAVKNGIAGIDADCGGACACATCHVYIDKAWVDRVGPINEMETGMLDFVQAVKSNSRLSCQINVTDALDGLIVSVPQSQH